MRTQLLLMGCGLILAGCSLVGGGKKEVEGELGVELLSWNDMGPIDYDDTTDWTKFSFSDFTLKMPRNFRVINLSDSQGYVELVNFAEVNGKVTADSNEFGNLKVKIAADTDFTNVDEAVGGKREVATMNIAGQKATKVDEGDKVVVYVKSLVANEVYRFEFNADFTRFVGLVDEVLGTVSFERRGSLN